MVVFWVIASLTILVIYIMSIDKKHHKITIKEQQAITQIIKTNIQEQQKRVYTKHNSTMKANEVIR